MSSTNTNHIRNRRTPPLLAEETDSGIPVLGGGSAMEPSPLEELIAKSTSEQAEASPLFPEQEEEEDVNHDNNRDTLSTTMSSASWITLAAGTLSLLHISFTWGSFLSPSWFDTHITVTVPWWENDTAPQTSTFSSAVDQTIQSTSLADIIQAFLSTDHMGISFCLVVSALIIPCLTMILCPMYIVTDFQQRSKRRSSSPTQEPYTTDPEQSSWPRVGLEVSLRITFLVFVLLCTLDVASSKIVLHHGDHSSILVSNRTTSGLVGYVLGTSAALFALCLLRYDTPLSSSPSRRTLPTTAQQESTQQQEQQEPLLQEDGSPTTTTHTTTAGEQQQQLSTFQKVIFFEATLLAVVLWLPMLSLPLFSVTYDGIASAFMETTSFQVRMIEFPSLLWKSGSLSETPQWITLSLGTALVLFVYVIPFIATILVVLTWWHRPNPSPQHISQQRKFKRILRWIQPCLAGGVFACALLIAVPALESITTFLLDSQSGGICANIKTLVDTPCLSIDGDLQLAIWFLLLHSVSLEVMVAVTVA